MKIGQEINCKFCNKNTLLVKKSIMDGWTKVGEALVCSSCGEIHCNLSDNNAHESNIKDTSKLDKLSALLGGESLEKIELESEEKIFCKDCKHYVIHPFSCKCGLTNKDINPIDDCEKFQRTESS